MVAIALLPARCCRWRIRSPPKNGWREASYQRAVAMEIVDGEIEILAAGEWLAFKSGAQDTRFHSVAATICRQGVSC